MPVTEITEPPRGMDDLLPEDFTVFNKIIRVVKELFRLYGYNQIETPPIEYYEIFAAKSGEEILQRMYVFTDKHNRKLVLRPEMTAPVARIVASKLSRRPLPLRLGYIADCYRLDEPQWGRRRRFYHGGFELFGSKDPIADVEILMIVNDFFRNIGIAEFSFKIGHVGIHRALMNRAGIREEIQDEILSLIDRARIDEARDLAKKNAKNLAPIRTLEELILIEPAPAKNLVEKVLGMLDNYEEAAEAAMNLFQIVTLASKTINSELLIYYPGFSRGLGYYTGMIFEVYGPLAEVALAGGGRYDKLVELFGGRPVPGVGAAIGITRVYQYLVDKLGQTEVVQPPDVYVAPLSQNAWGYSLDISRKLREQGIATEIEVMARGISDVIKSCEKRGIRFLIIIGDKEVEQHQITVRDLNRREQTQCSLEELWRIADLIKGGR
ncbi:MAG: histidine--tRNA ligase [Nitrososphaerota archaeon]